MKHVIVVNANRPDADQLSAAVRSLPAKVTAFHQSAEALQFLKAHEPPDLIVMDIHLPEIDGWRFASLIRSPDFERTGRTPLLATSRIFSGAGLNLLARALSAGRVLPLPCETAAIAESMRELLDAPAPRAPRALIIDDDPEAIRLLERGLTRYGYELATGSSEADALRLLKSQSFDLCIVDHRLERAEAIDFMANPVAAARDSHCVFIVITGVTDPDLAVRYSRAGFDAFIQKPFSIAYLVELINRAHRDKTWRKVEQWIALKTHSLRDAEERFRDLFENAPVGYHSLGPDGTITAMNATELAWLGYAADELIGLRTIFDLQTPASAARGRRVFDELAALGTIRDVELELIRKDGSILPAIIDSVAILDERGGLQSCRTILRDVTERRRLELHLRQTQKMEALGVLAAGIAHNFNNLLTPIMANTSELLERCPAGSEDRELLQDVMDASRRAALLVRDISILSVSARHPPKPVRLQALLSSTLDALRRTVGKRIHFDVTEDPDLPAVPGVADQIQQALVNICSNACDAIEGKGEISIGLQSLPVSIRPTLDGAERPRTAPFVRVSVIDSGGGIPFAIRERIFDPFFTTRGLALHTGLGLSVAGAIVKSHQGFIDWFSEEGEGARFDLYFPVEPAALPADYLALSMQAGATREPTAPAAAPATLLLIEDDPIQLRSTARVLQRAGYNVIPADDGVKALDILRRALTRSSIGGPSPAGAQGIQLILLDMVMPGMTGERVLQRIRGMTSGIPVIVASGWDTGARQSDWLKQGATDIVSKPFENQTLLDAIQRTLKP